MSNRPVEKNHTKPVLIALAVLAALGLGVVAGPVPMIVLALLTLGLAFFNPQVTADADRQPVRVRVDRRHR
ncbi:MAG: hypothetical protein AAGG56_10105 [Pseudomonadota bacterium]